MGNALEGKTAIITGGTAGIGKAMVSLFASEGARVAFLGTNKERGEALERETEGKATFYQVDVASTVATTEVVNTVLSSFSNVDILINNAGITRDGLLMKMSEEDWDRVLEVNVKSCYNLCRALTRSMMKARKGKIINISSVVGVMGNAGQTNYAASKAAIIGFTKALAKELAPRNICVNCIAPGFIETPMTEVMSAQQKEGLLDAIPLKRMGTPREVADLALFLAGDLSNYMTGQVLLIDGGMTLL